MKRIFIEIVDMDFSQICSSPGKFTHFQEIVTFPEAVQVLKQLLRKILRKSTILGQFVYLLCFHLLFVVSMVTSPFISIV